jgi:FHS family Na+ dependent glucose MFS transporter 1
MNFVQSLKDRSSKEIYYFITYGIAFVALGLGLSSIGPLLPYLAENVKVSFAQISFVFTASSLGYMAGSAGGGRLYDRFKGHRLMVIALSLLIASLFLFPVTNVFYVLLALMFMAGLGQGLIDVGGNLNLLWIFQARVGPYMNALHFAFGVGAFLSPIIVHNVMQWSGGLLTWPFWALAILSIPSYVGLVLLSSPKNPEKEAIEENKKTVNVRLVILMVLLFFIYCGVEGGFGGWIFTYATTLNITGQTGASYMNSFFWGALTLGRLVSIPLARKIAPSRLLLTNFGLAIAFMGLILVFPLNTVVLWIGSIGLGLSFSSIFPTLMSLAESRLQITGAVTGYFFLGVSLGAMSIPMLLGQIFDYIGHVQIMTALMVLLGLGLVVLLALIITSNSLGEKERA